MKLMIDGRWRGDVVPTAELAAGRLIHAGAFRQQVSANGSSGFPASAGRYHLLVSYACPFAHRVILGHALKQLAGLVGLSVLHPRWNTEAGWVFGAPPLATADGSGEGFTHLHQAYSTARPCYTGKVTVPVLWDAATRRIISNESLEILGMLNEAFNGLGARADVDLYPAGNRQQILALQAKIAADLAGGVYEVAGATSQAEYDIALDRVFTLLDGLEWQLGDGRPFLHGSRLAGSDIVAFTPLVRFDAVYNPLFRVSRKRLVDYPRLAAWARRLHDMPGAAQTVRMDHILTHYHDGDWAVANRRDIVPEAPAIDYRSTART